MHLQTFYPTPPRCRWLTIRRAGIVFRVPFIRRLVCIWFGRRAVQP